MLAGSSTLQDHLSAEWLRSKMRSSIKLLPVTLIPKASITKCKNTCFFCSKTNQWHFIPPPPPKASILSIFLWISIVSYHHKCTHVMHSLAINQIKKNNLKKHTLQISCTLSHNTRSEPEEQMLRRLKFKSKTEKNCVSYLLNTHQSHKVYCAWSI